MDDTLIPLSSAAMVLMRELVRLPGNVVTRADLLKLMPGEGCDEHAVEMAVGRLRTALGDPRVILTVVKRGYRLAYDPERISAGTADWHY
jgi:uroporphyrinogen-III synthase